MRVVVAGGSVIALDLRAVRKFPNAGSRGTDKLAAGRNTVVELPARVTAPGRTKLFAWLACGTVRIAAVGTAWCVTACTRAGSATPRLTKCPPFARKLFSTRLCANAARASKLPKRWNRQSRSQKFRNGTNEKYEYGRPKPKSSPTPAPQYDHPKPAR